MPCDCTDSFVVDSRHWRGTIRRRRVCSSCGRSWKTIEVVERERSPIGKVPGSAPTSVHPVVRLVFDELVKQNLSKAILAERSGIGASTLGHWKAGKTSPRLSDLEAVLNVLGYTVSVSVVSKV